MKPAQALLLTSAAALLLVSTRRAQAGVIEAGDGDVLSMFQPGAVLDSVETLWNVVTEESAMVDQTTANRNIGAFLQVLRMAEGTEGRGVDPYRVCYGYSHTIMDMSDHPAVTGEWRGQRLPDAMCANAGFSPGCVSSAAGAYQFIKGTWLVMRNALRLPDFSAASQDAACVEQIRRLGALQDVQAGRFALAVSKCRNTWASLPGNYAKQGQRSIETLASWYSSAGGAFA